jgi:hypothetical protein
MRAHALMQDFKDMRDQIQEKVREFSVYFRVRAPYFPNDYKLSFSRVAYAMYLLDTLEQALHAIDRKGGESLVPSFESAARAVRRLFTPDYFSISGDQLVSSHHVLEGPLSACMSKIGVSVLLPEPAVESKAAELGRMIDDFNRIYF